MFRVLSPAESALLNAPHNGYRPGFAIEPPAADNPLFTLHNVIVTPHVAARTGDATRNVGIMAANNLVSY
jgi:D-3-phosphoglycerate dehydrogenase / 2-oxoglutarate reductase